MKLLGVLLSFAILICPMDAAVFPPHSVVEGKTLQEWSAQWWKWALSLPVDKSPLVDETGANATNGQGGKVFFLAGVFNTTGRATRSIRLPEGLCLFFPIVNNFSAHLGEGVWGLTDLRDGGIFLATSNEFHGTLDGSPFTNLLYTTGRRVQTLADHREIAPEFSFWLPPTNTVSQVINGVIDPAYSDGYWLMLSPLSVGQHTLTFGGSMGPPYNFSTELTYHICVEPVVLADAVKSLINRVRNASLPKGGEQALLASLNAAESSFASNHIKPGINQLEAFQHKVRAQIAKDNPTLAEDLMRTAQCLADTAERRIK